MQGTDSSTSWQLAAGSGPSPRECGLWICLRRRAIPGGIVLCPGGGFGFGSRVVVLLEVHLVQSHIYC